MTERNSDEIAAQIESWISEFGADRLQAALDRYNAENVLPVDPREARAVASIARTCANILKHEGYPSCQLH